MRLITVVMNEPDISKRSADTSKMLDYGFNVYMVRNIIDDSSIIDKVKVELSPYDLNRGRITWRAK